MGLYPVKLKSLRSPPLIINTCPISPNLLILRAVIHKLLVANVLCIFLNYGIIIIGGAPVSTWKQSTDGMQRIRLASLKSRNDITVKTKKAQRFEFPTHAVVGSEVAAAAA